MDEAPDRPFLGVTRSLSGKVWQARSHDAALARRFSQQLGVPEALGQILASRNVLLEDGAHFLDPKLRDYFPDPSTFKDMDKAARIILDTLADNKKISIFADYDVDGATSSAMLRRWFRAMGAEAGLYVPDRIKEGYGPTIAAFETLMAEGVDLVITVDCGAVSTGPLTAAHDMGLGVIVLDHHLMPKDAPMPPTLALVNPNRPDDTSGQGVLAAAGVVFVLLAALNREARTRGQFKNRDEPDLIALADIAALGTICDVASLTGFNRALVAQGLKVMSRTDHAGILALAEVANAEPPFGTYHAGFVLGPRINAGGRVGQADLGARLLASDDSAECNAIAALLDRFNMERRDIEQGVQEAAIAAIEARNNDDPVIVVAGQGWHPGVIGIVSGRLKERYGVPSFVIALDPGTGEGKGSGRSVSGINLGEAIGAAVAAGVIEKGGGHAMAGGLSLRADQVDAFRIFLIKTIGDEARRLVTTRSLKIDALMSARGADRSFVDELQSAAPFGMGNPEPMFAFGNLRVRWAQALKGGHVRCTLEDASGGGSLNAIAFRAEDNGFADILLAQDGAVIHVAGKLKADNYRGRNSVDLRIEDVAIADNAESALE
ncbi:MAG: single-stranded-DNA-specific exonuclease RecJ [Robiginitomaculum sp.]|nr:MAG: single-stranded-DNA-specific exonuclease RecJ [Robiginitomaculum sp.]